MTSNMNYIVALGVGFKCPRKIHLNAQCPPLRIFQPSYDSVKITVKKIPNNRPILYLGNVHPKNDRKR